MVQEEVPCKGPLEWFLQQSPFYSGLHTTQYSFRKSGLQVFRYEKTMR